MGSQYSLSDYNIEFHFNIINSTKKSSLNQNVWYMYRTTHFLTKMTFNKLIRDVFGNKIYCRKLKSDGFLFGRLHLTFNLESGFYGLNIQDLQPGSKVGCTFPPGFVSCSFVCFCVINVLSIGVIYVAGFEKKIWFYS